MQILKISQEPLSLESPVGDEGDAAGRLHQGRRRHRAAQAVSETMRREELGQVLGTLTRRERKIIELRFGLKDEHPRTLEEVGQQFGVTRERIRQIEGKTLAKLKSYHDAQGLRDFLDVAHGHVGARARTTTRPLIAERVTRSVSLRRRELAGDAPQAAGPDGQAV